jgi:pteridine reductase
MKTDSASPAASPDHPNKVALVTGGAVRIGRALSLGLANQGFDIAAHYHSSEREAASLESEVNATGRDCLTVRADLAQADQVEGVVSAVKQRFGRLDLLVNSASTFHEQPLFEAGPEEWDQVMAVNLRAPFLLSRAAEGMLREGGASIVNIVDVSAFEPWLRYPHHAVSKAGLLHLTRVMARYLAPDVRVNAVAPGTVLPPEDSSAEDIERERLGTLVERLGSPEDVVEAVLFLERSAFISGEVLVVDGGMRWR